MASGRPSACCIPAVTCCRRCHFWSPTRRSGCTGCGNRCYGWACRCSRPGCWRGVCGSPPGGNGRCSSFGLFCSCFRGRSCTTSCWPPRRCYGACSLAASAARCWWCWPVRYGRGSAGSTGLRCRGFWLPCFICWNSRAVPNPAGATGAGRWPGSAWAAWLPPSPMPCMWFSRATRSRSLARASPPICSGTVCCPTRRLPRASCWRPRWCRCLPRWSCEGRGGSGNSIQTLPAGCPRWPCWASCWPAG